MTLSYHDTISWYDSVITHHSRTVVLLVYHNKLWWSMVYHVIPVYHGIPWCTMVYHGISLIYHGTTVHHGTTMWWHIAVVLRLPWYTVVHHGTPRHDCDVLWHCR